VKQEIVIFDIDGTLADVSERIHHLQKNPRIVRPLLVGWHKTKRSNRCAFVTFLFLGSLGSLCSGRSEEHRSETIAWLKKERVKYYELRLRKSGDRRSDVIVKREMLHQSMKQKSCSSSKIAIESWKCGAKKAWYACSAPRANSEGEYD
jgi:FMN phosphatase YigB (HAD superfamily)